MTSVLKQCEKHPERYCNCEGYFPACRDAQTPSASTEAAQAVLGDMVLVPRDPSSISTTSSASAAAHRDRLPTRMPRLSVFGMPAPRSATATTSTNPHN